MENIYIFDTFQNNIYNIMLMFRLFFWPYFVVQFDIYASNMI